MKNKHPSTDLPVKDINDFDNKDIEEIEESILNRKSINPQDDSKVSWFVALTKSFE